MRDQSNEAGVLDRFKGIMNGRVRRERWSGCNIRFYKAARLLRSVWPRAEFRVLVRTDVAYFGHGDDQITRPRHITSTAITVSPRTDTGRHASTTPIFDPHGSLGHHVFVGSITILVENGNTH